MRKKEEARVRKMREGKLEEKRLNEPCETKCCERSKERAR